MAVAVLFREPRMSLPPLAPKAASATPTVRATITARPTINVVALPTNITLLATLLIMLCAPCLVGPDERRVPLTGSSWSRSMRPSLLPRACLRITQLQYLLHLFFVNFLELRHYEVRLRILAVSYVCWA